MRKIILAATISLLLGSGSAFAEKGGKHGHGHGNDHGNERGDRNEQRRDDARQRDGGTSIDFHFGDSHRSAINDYYAPRMRAGNCPPGLAKKGNGCMPPGQAKKWNMGRPLPRDVTYYPLPHDLMLRLPAPPSGHRYVRVAGDILLIAIGTSMVVDAIQDIAGN